MNKMKEHFSSRVTKLLVILALAIVASVMFVFVGCGEQHVHTWTQTKEQAATCTADGFIEYTCEECGDVRQEPVQATGHQWKDNGALQTHPATCTESGYYYKLCTVCNYEETSDRIPATGHTLAFADATVTLPTCTADGSVTGKCADCGADVTWTADQIAAGKDANGLVVTLTGAPESNPTVDGKVVEYYGKDGFLQTLGHDYRFESNTHSCVAAFDNTYVAVFGDDAAKTASEYYWNYCDRCKTAFEVEEHSVPANAVPCEVLINPNTNQAYPVPATADAPEYYTGDGKLVTDSVYAVAGSAKGYSYVCEECDNYIAAVDHNYQLMSLVSGTPGDPNDPAVWEAAPADATFSCKYYEVCEWCEIARISAPHKPNMAAPTCTEDVVCEECGAIMESATGHTTFVGGAFGDFKSSTIAATCTTPQINLTHCAACANREMQGEDVEWVLGENYKEEPVGQPLGHKYVAKTVYDTSVDAVGCARPFWYQDVCSVCKEDVTGHIRIEVKPTAYTRTGTEGNYTYTAVTDSTLKTGTAYFMQNADGTYTQIANVGYYNDGLKQDGKTYYTDENGYYNRQPGGTHDWRFISQTSDGELINYENNAQLTQFVMPTCSSEGMVLYFCDKCDSYSWMSISLKDYLDGYDIQVDTDGDGVNETVHVNGMKEAAKDTDYAKEYPTYSAAIKTQKYHEATMYTCGHAECAECKTMEHNVQYSVSFVVNLDKAYAGVTAPTIDTFYGWTCWVDDVEKTNLTNFIAGYTTDTDEDAFTYAFFSDAAMKTAMDWTLVGMPVNENAYSQFITVYVKAVPKVDYTIEFNTDAITNPALTGSEAFEEQFAYRTVYMAQTDKSQAAPAIAGYRFTFKDAEGKPFNFATFDWNNVTGDTVTIYVS